MPLTPEQEQAEYELRMEHMVVDIAKMRAEIEQGRASAEQSRVASDANIAKIRHDIEQSRVSADANIAKMHHDMKWEARKFLVSTVLALAAAVGAGVAIGNYLAVRPAAPAVTQPPPLRG